ncbi:uncharacterized protein K452DRAFT_237777 [Aplosporella prunicola CBS 121167]|uniref:DUF7924 domain-containing protein n=1 Tax=Aplosporella prunicola CBS 121167 TaxID=1176127 RepID=A0A6A6AWG4_9PEZI|nr:uncharacterized protein K452DRAFT_237777 [Aplosporella prunicola CBS 121167]KAF2136279.1 hypothetical protein K452DRAFT_237777 [Aplosporella prunicola CBS 121167]
MPAISDAASTSTRPLRSADSVSRGGSTTNRSRSSSPSKLSPQNYRAQVLDRVGIRIDVEVPDEGLEQLLPPQGDAEVRTVGQELYAGARALLERQTANEVEWAGLLNTAIHSLMQEQPDQLICLPNRDWQSCLKPVALTHKLTSGLPQKRHPSDYPSPDQSQSTTAAAAPFANQPHLPPPQQRLKLEPAPARLQPKTPRPDLTIGLNDSDASWDADGEVWARAGLRGRDVKGILADLQATGTGGEDAAAAPLITDPCTASPSGLRFPFLVVEAKSGGSASIADAENQAAVAGTCALKILRSVAGEQQQQQDAAADADAPFKMRMFSLTTEGPTHVLWAHYRSDSSEWAMVWLGAYRVTNRRSAGELVAIVARILRWGAREFRDWVRASVVRYLGRISAGD